MKLVGYEKVDVKNVLIVMIKHGCIGFKAENESLEASDGSLEVFIGFRSRF